jgi:hypothetical protein
MDTEWNGQDRAEITDALYRFGAGQDLADAALFASAFAPDATLDFTQPAQRLGVQMMPMEGREHIVATIMATLSQLDTTHTVTNPRIDIDGDRATMFALVEAQHLPKSDHSRNLLLKNIYTLSLARDGRRWLIEHLKIVNVWYRGDRAVLFGE